MKHIIDKITDIVIAIMTLLTPLFLIVGIFGIDSPDTALPEALLIIGLLWVGFIVYCSNEKDTEILKNEMK